MHIFQDVHVGMIFHMCVCEFDELMWMIGPVDRKSQSIKVAEMHN